MRPLWFLVVCLSYLLALIDAITEYVHKQLSRAMDWLHEKKKRIEWHF